MSKPQWLKDGIWQHQFPNPSLVGGKQQPGWCDACNQASKEIQEKLGRDDIVTYCEKHNGWYYGLSKIQGDSDV